MENTKVGPFQVVTKLGAHRRHNVYLARQTEQQREVALKFIKLPPGVDREKAIGKIEREVAVIKQLEHENLVKLFGAGVHESQVFFAHELIEGEALSAILGRRGRLAADQVVEYGTQIANALEYLHQNEIIHSKLTADKILIDTEGKIKIADLRLNRSRKRRWDAAKRASLEIAAYMSPEQLLGSGATAKSDLYSLGVLLYEMLTGRLPFEPQTMAQLARDKQTGNTKQVAESVMTCPSWLDKLVTKLIHVDPKQRPHSARAVAMTLEQIRTVDQSKKTVAEEMTRGFSALSAGKDKSEARRVLGQKPVKEKKEAGPIMQSLPFLIGGLSFIGLIVALVVFWPFSPNRRDWMAEATLLLNSASYEDWQEARRRFKRMRNSSDEELAAEAETKYFLVRRKSMIYQIDYDKGRLMLRPEIREFKRAYLLQKAKRLDEAISMYQQLMEAFDQDSELIYVYHEMKERVETLTAAKQQAAEFRLQVEEDIAKADELAKSPETMDEALKIWNDVANKYTGNEYLEGLVMRADAGLLAHSSPTLAPPKETGTSESSGDKGTDEKEESEGESNEEDNDAKELNNDSSG